MNIEESFPNSPAFRELKERVGPLAMEYIVRLGTHCVQSKITVLEGDSASLHFFSGAREEISREELEAAMVDSGMVEPIESGYRMTFFAAMNHRLVKNWENGSRFGFGSEYRKRKSSAKVVPLKEGTDNSAPF